jgi:hypothetical protein
MLPIYVKGRIRLRSSPCYTTTLDFMKDGSSIDKLMPAENYLLFYNRSRPNEFGDSKARSNLKQFVKGIVIKDLR